MADLIQLEAQPMGVPPRRQPAPIDAAGTSGLPAAYRYIDPAERGAIAPAGPRNVFIEVTNHCNLLCQTCPRTFVTYERLHTLGWESFVGIVEQFPELQRAVLHGIGEPLLNRELPRMVAHLKARGVYVLFNTNATLLDRARGRALIEAGLDELRCSIDGARRETYALVRGVDLFPRVLANLRDFCALQRELEAERPRVSLWVTAMKENLGELPEVIRLAADLGVPEVYVQRMVYYLDPAERVGLMRPEGSVYDDYGDLEERVLAECERLSAELGVAVRASGATDPRHSLAGGRSASPRPWAACMRPWTTAYVTANGNCLPCCIAPFATRAYETLVLGNLFDAPFASIWNDQRYQRWRTALLSDHPHPACAGCGVHWSL